MTAPLAPFAPLTPTVLIDGPTGTVLASVPPATAPAHSTADNPQHLDLFDESLIDPNTPPLARSCQVDSLVVGGPYAHSPEIYIQHIQYPDDLTKCYDSYVCLAHLPWSWGFVANEIGTPDWYRCIISTAPYVEA